MLHGAHGDTKIEALLKIGVQQAMNQAGCKRIPSSEPIDNFYFISSRPQDFISPAGDGGPIISPDKRVFSDCDGHNLKRKLLQELSPHFLIVPTGYAKNALG